MGTEPLTPPAPNPNASQQYHCAIFNASIKTRELACIKTIWNNSNFVQAPTPLTRTIMLKCYTLDKVEHKDLHQESMRHMIIFSNEKCIKRKGIYVKLPKELCPTAGSCKLERPKTFSFEILLKRFDYIINSCFNLKQDGNKITSF